jgi:small subunit ribosomal protein S3
MVPRRARAAAHACAPMSTTACPTAHTAYGVCGVKVWIFKGEILEHDPMAQDKRIQQMQEGGGQRSRRDREGARN